MTEQTPLDVAQIEFEQQVAQNVRLAGIPFLDELLEALMRQLVDMLSGQLCKRDPVEVIQGGGRRARYAAEKCVDRTCQRRGYAMSGRDKSELERELLTYAESCDEAKLRGLVGDAQAEYIPDYTGII